MTTLPAGSGCSSSCRARISNMTGSGATSGSSSHIPPPPYSMRTLFQPATSPGADASSSTQGAPAPSKVTSTKKPLGSAPTSGLVSSCPAVARTTPSTGTKAVWKQKLTSSTSELTTCVGAPDEASESQSAP